MESMQDLANKINKMIYAYRMEDHTVKHSTQSFCVGDFIEGKKIIEVMGAFVPKQKTQQ